MKDLAKFLTENYNSGARLCVRFTKANGDERTMTVQKNEAFYSAIQGARHFSSSTTTLRVTELLADNTSQWRSIPLTRLIAVDLV